MNTLLLGLALASAAPSEIAYMSEGRVWLVKGDGSGKRELAKGSYDRPLLWSPDGSRLIFWKENPTWQLFQVEIATGKTTDLTQNRVEDCRAASYSRDGREIAFMSGERGLCVMRSDGSQLRNLSSKGHRDARPFFAKNGDILFQDIENGKFAVLRYRAASGLISEVADAASFAATSDGRLMAFVPRGAGQPDLVILDLDTGAKRAELLEGRKFDDVGWAWAGDRLVARTFAPEHALWVIDAGGRGRKWASVHFDAWVGFDLSPDGRALVYSDGHRPDEAIWVVHAPGGKPRRIATGVWPVWRPSARH